MDADEFEALKKTIEETPSHDIRAVEEHLARTMEQAQREGNRERAEDYKELLRIAMHLR